MNCLPSRLQLWPSSAFLRLVQNDENLLVLLHWLRAGHASTRPSHIMTSENSTPTGPSMKNESIFDTSYQGKTAVLSTKRLLTKISTIELSTIMVMSRLSMRVCPLSLSLTSKRRSLPCSLRVSMPSVVADTAVDCVLSTMRVSFENSDGRRCSE